jgi:ribonucleoside-diphosphate reductase alpha chain
LGLTFLSGHPEFGRSAGGYAPVADAAPAATVGIPTLPQGLISKPLPTTEKGDSKADPLAEATNDPGKGIGGRSTKLSGRGDQFARFQSDAPTCDNCGTITVRNGNCYLCHNCGNSMGCS